MELVHFETARRELELARSIDEVKDIRDKAEALRAYARQAGLSLAMQNQCAEIKLRAERKAGEMLKETERNKGGNPNLLHDATGLPPSYEDLGIEPTKGRRWQKIAAIPEPDFERHIAETKAAEEELTTAGVLKGDILGGMHDTGTEGGA